MPRRRAQHLADAATPVARALASTVAMPVDAMVPLSLPAPLPDPERPGFPVLATLTPIAGAVVLWVITGSPFALVFAALGPVAAVASLLDGRRQQRRRRRRGAVERSAAFAELDERVRLRHDAERAEAWRRSGSARAALAAPPGSDWRHPDAGRAVLGRASGESSLRLDGTPRDDDDRAALARAAVCEGLPLAAAVADGIGFVGPPALARAAARAALVQAAHRAAPDALAIDLPREAWSWAMRLPHRTGARRLALVDGGSTRPDGRAEGGCIAVAPSEADLPPGLATVLRLESPTAAVLVRYGGLVDRRPVTPELVSEREAAEWAIATARAAAGAATPVEPPRSVPWSTLPQPAGEVDGRARLRAVVGQGVEGRVELDLVADGPHALVAGTTGSGKSEFLLAWVAALAAAYPPEAVAFLLVDFKGGAAFAPLEGLPHVTGIVTDLDEAEARRAVASLRAELRHREQVLAAAGARDLAALDAGTTLPRLVVVVDEFPAMIERFPALGEVIADLAARGRSLGVHLVLAAQRPNGVVRDAITANCQLRIALRVLARSDSVAVIGSDHAAGLPAGTPGRAVLVRGDGRPTVFQSAFADAGALDGLRLRRADAAPARRPWLEPLPHRLAPEHPDLVALIALREPTDAVVFGLADDPDRQRRVAAAWNPERDGNLLVVGAPGSGRTGALAAVARAWQRSRPRAGLVVLDGPRSRQWDALRGELEAVRTGRSGDRLLLIDDLDLRFRGWPEPYRLEAAELIDSLTREGRSAGLVVAASARSANSAGRFAFDGFGQVLRLRHATRADLVQAGGAGELWNDADPVGAGLWRGLRVQVAEVGRIDEAAPPARVPELGAADLRAADSRSVAVVSPSPRSDAPVVAALVGSPPLMFDARPDGARAAEAALAAIDVPGRPIVLAADAESWAGAWSLAAAMRDTAVLVVRGGPLEYRALARDRGLPPLLDERPAQCWLLRPGEAPIRRRWPPTSAEPIDATSAPHATETVENSPHQMRIP
ncbi:hypothetical protein FLP10_02540 [Agromyces intestinalis]|uniref:FtsK domain-containing protein n=1 Tax=Agromyces intestinalis TaxID=2592652 RepID=A0A5C1YBD9_9MICO|nr:FtsK/SpoIIIE domain-containing protein [Agromyces intestinalis]QEO13413.1 hypothetical protein FLP10_02540 [Agromyces intestinalis]